MNLHNAEFLTTAVRRIHYPPENLPEIALVGRSNVGKSSFINKLLNRKNLARTSSNPGKTATINFYEIDDAVRFVDLPGYGFANVSKEEKKRWSVMIDEYLKTRRNLSKVVLLLDARRTPSEDDKTMFSWIVDMGFEPFAVITKIDKVKKSQLEANIANIKETLGIENVIPFSAETGFGRDDAIKELLEQ